MHAMLELISTSCCDTAIAEPQVFEPGCSKHTTLEVKSVICCALEPVDNEE
jgi:hypothetical protein